MVLSLGVLKVDLKACAPKSIPTSPPIIKVQSSE